MNTMTSDMLEKMLHVEESYVLQQSYLAKSSTIKPEMRSKLVTWMLEVCEEQGLTDEIYSLSVNLFDRFMHHLIYMTQFPVSVEHLQLFGITSMFVAAKLKGKTDILTSLVLVDYTADTVSVEELIDCELAMLDKLKWDIAAIMPNDYFDLLVNNIAINSHDLPMIKKHFHAFTALCSTEFKFSFYPASMIAAACLLTSIDGLINSNSIQNSSLLVNQSAYELSNLIHSDIDSLYQVKELVDGLYVQNSNVNTDSIPTCSSNVQLCDEIELDFNLSLLDGNSNEYVLTDELDYEFDTSSYDIVYSPLKKSQAICIDIDNYGKKNGFSRSSSSSSGVSSIASNNFKFATSCSLLTPPMANLVPLPSF